MPLLKLLIANGHIFCNDTTTISCAFLMPSGDAERLRWEGISMFVINVENDIIDTTPVETGIAPFVKTPKKNSGLKLENSSL